MSTSERARVVEAVRGLYDLWCVFELFQGAEFDEQTQEAIGRSRERVDALLSEQESEGELSSAEPPRGTVAACRELYYPSGWRLPACLLCPQPESPEDSWFACPYGESERFGLCKMRTCAAEKAEWKESEAPCGTCAATEVCGDADLPCPVDGSRPPQPGADEEGEKHRCGTCGLHPQVCDGTIPGCGPAHDFYRWRAAPAPSPQPDADEYPKCPRCEGKRNVEVFCDGGPEPPCPECEGKGFIVDDDPQPDADEGECEHLTDTRCGHCGDGTRCWALLKPERTFAGCPMRVVASVDEEPNGTAAPAPDADEGECECPHYQRSGTADFCGLQELDEERVVCEHITLKGLGKRDRCPIRALARQRDELLKRQEQMPAPEVADDPPDAAEECELADAIAVLASCSTEGMTPKLQTALAEFVPQARALDQGRRDAERERDTWRCRAEFRGRRWEEAIQRYKAACESEGELETRVAELEKQLNEPVRVSEWQELKRRAEDAEKRVKHGRQLTYKAIRRYQDAEKRAGELEAERDNARRDASVLREGAELLETDLAELKATPMMAVPESVEVIASNLRARAHQLREDGYRETAQMLDDLAASLEAAQPLGELVLRGPMPPMPEAEASETSWPRYIRAYCSNWMHPLADWLEPKTESEEAGHVPDPD